MSIDESRWWSWLRKQLAREIGVTFHRGRRRVVQPAAREGVIRQQVLMTPVGRRAEVCERLAELHRVSVKTIERIVTRYASVTQITVTPASNHARRKASVGQTPIGQ